MNAAIRWVDYWNRKVRRLTIADVKLIQLASMAVILIVVKLVPQIMSLSIWWFVALFAVSALRPVYVFWLQEDTIRQDAA